MSETTLSLSADEAMVLLDWFAELHLQTGPKRHPGTQQALWDLEAMLEPLVEEVFCSDYELRLHAAQRRLSGALGATPRTAPLAPVNLTLTREEVIVLHHWLTEEAPREALEIDAGTEVALARLVQRLQPAAVVPGADPEALFVSARASLEWED